jgi:hypothetical protein
MGSIGFPDTYPAYLNCTWVITAGPGKKIQATFRHITKKNAPKISQLLTLRHQNTAHKMK